MSSHRIQCGFYPKEVPISGEQILMEVIAPWGRIQLKNPPPYQAMKSNSFKESRLVQETFRDEVRAVHEFMKGAK